MTKLWFRFAYAVVCGSAVANGCLFGRENFDDLKPHQTGGSAGSGAKPGGAAGIGGAAGTGGALGQGGTRSDSGGAPPDAALDSEAGGATDGSGGSDGGAGTSGNGGDGSTGMDAATDSSVADAERDSPADATADAHAHDAGPKFILSSELLVAPAADNVSNFGRSVALDSSWAIVGAEEPTATGVAYLGWRQPPGGWKIITKLQPAGGPLSGANFGYSVDMALEMAMVGAPGNASRPGQVYFYYLTGESAWLDMQAPVGATDPKPGDRFGHDVVVDSTWRFVVVGAPGEADGRGAVYVYADSPRDWYETGKIVPPSPAKSFGSKVSVNKRTLAVCSRPDTESPQGTIWIYEVQAFPFVATLKQTLRPSSPNHELYCDQALALGDVLLLAAAKSPEGGVVYTYALDSTGWQQTSETLTLPASASIGPGDFGVNTVLCDSYAAIGHRSRPSPASDVFFERRGFASPWQSVGSLSQLASGTELTGVACQFFWFLVGDKAADRGRGGVWFLELEDR